MNAFNWERMRNTPEGKLIKSEREKGREELIEAFAKQAESDLDTHDRYGELRNDVEKRQSEIVSEDDVAEKVIDEIVRKHERTLRDDKGLEDKEDQTAYIIALVREIQKRKEQLH